jgi:hypothetical protein
MHSAFQLALTKGKMNKNLFFFSDLKRMKDLHHDHLGTIQIHISVFHGLKQCMEIPVCKMPAGINIKSLNFANIS